MPVIVVYTSNGRCGIFYGCLTGIGSTYDTNKGALPLVAFSL